MDLVDRYLACWNETDPSARRRLIEDLCSPDLAFVDPLVDVQGPSGLDATIAGAQDQFPGFVFTRVGSADSHHHVTRFQWGLGPAGTEPIVIGFDVLATDAAGHIEFVAGFFDKVPAAA